MARPSRNREITHLFDPIHCGKITPFKKPRSAFMRYFLFLFLLGQAYTAELSQFHMRPAKVEDVDTLYELICDLAAFEGKNLATLPVNKENLKEHGFGPTPYF
jgi:hypothetical protein